jgi:hypothetical protein
MAASAPSGAAGTEPQGAWQARGTAEIQALDKISTRSATLTIRVGQAAQFGTLTVTVEACVARSPEQTPDSAAFLIVNDPRPGAPTFRGWMFASDPAVSMLEHPIYDVRVLACR